MKKQLLSIVIAFFILLLTIAPCLADTIKHPQIQVNPSQPHLSKSIDQQYAITKYEDVKKKDEDVNKKNEDGNKTHDDSNKSKLPKIDKEWPESCVIWCSASKCGDDC